MTFDALALQNLLSPMVLFFVLGAALSLARSDLSIPGSIAKLLSLYLMLSIGFRGGAEVAHHGLSPTLGAAMTAGLVLSFGIPFVAFGLLRTVTRLPAVDAASVAAHYGSISAVTLVAVMGVLQQLDIAFEGYMIAVAAAMETPAILSALLLARRGAAGGGGPGARGELAREILLNGAVVMLLGSFAIGALTGERGQALLKPFLVEQFPGFLCLFLLEMGITASKRLVDLKHAGWRFILFGLLAPNLFAAFGITVAHLYAMALGTQFELGTYVLFAVLCGAASYIAVPAVQRLAIPEASPTLPLAASLGLTFSYNVTIGIPVYILIAKAVTTNFPVV